jgi:LmbE family N-acetylglucosaminyl deacetylase
MSFNRLLPFVLASALSLPVAGQLRPQPVAELPGTVSLQLMLRKLGSVGTFMQTDAHPDDEDNALLAMLGHGQGMRTVLVTATRGDGGQNEIGPELFQSLGVLRTEELLAVHRFDGAEQFFTRAVDFGFSFSVEESIQKWGHDEILGDYVRHIRALRPDVIVGFLCGGEGGGQHHQASARLTVEAFRAAADRTKFPEHIKEGLRPWQAQRVFCTDTASFGRRAGPRTPDLLTADVTGFDPVLGRTYGELGIEARSMHKCQGTSQLLPLPGQSLNRTYRLRDSVIGQPGVAPASLFEGIDTSLRGLERFGGEHPPADLTSAIASIAAAVSRATAALAAQGPGAAAPPLVDGLAAVRALRARLPKLSLSDEDRYELDFRLTRKEEQFQQAVVLAYGMRFEALADDGVVMRGEPLKLSFAIANHGPADVTLSGVDVAGVASLTGVASCTGTIKKESAYTCSASGAVPATAPMTGPYWTPRPDAARYDFDLDAPSGRPLDAPFGLPFRPSPFLATFHVSIGGAEIRVPRVLQFRYDNVVAGEKRMEVTVAPAFSVRLSPDIVIFPAASARAAKDSTTRRVQVVVTNQHKGPAEGTVSLQVPQGWTATPARVTVKFAREDEEATLRFDVSRPPAARAGDYVVRASATDSDGAYDTGYEVVEYPHTSRRHVPKAATARIEVIDVAIAPTVRVGYIMGVGDQVPQALAQLGAAVDLISPEQLASGDLSQYSVIMTGVRAYERRPDLRANNQRLIAYAEQGGTVLVQYNKFEFNDAQYGPYPAKVSANRVTDENAPIEVLAPTHPVFSTPNKLGPETWAGWVQERGLYFLGERDSRYVDLLQSADPFEYNRGIKTGALVEARVGKGRWVYIGLGLWRQLPAGTEGAYRLMANLVSLR